MSEESNIDRPEITPVEEIEEVPEAVPVEEFRKMMLTVTQTWIATVVVAMYVAMYVLHTDIFN